MAIDPVAQLSARYVDDEHIILEWGDVPGCDGVLIESQENDGEWRLVENCGHETSYSFERGEPNSKYRFRAVAFTDGQQAAPATSEAVYTTPAALVSLAGYRNGDGSVLIVPDNGMQRYATSMTIERSMDGSAWVVLCECDPEEGHIEDAVEDAVAYRARNSIASLTSPWVQTGAIGVMPQAPYAPSITVPVDGSIVVAKGGGIDVAWVYAGDGFQEAAEIGWSIDGSEWAYVTVGEETSCQIPASEGRLQLTVRTRNSMGYSQASAASIEVVQAPEVIIEAPQDDVFGFPLEVRFKVAQAAHVVSSIVSVLEGERVLCSKTVYASSAMFTEDELALEDGKTYAVRVESTSSAALTGAAEKSFQTYLNVPAKPRLHITAIDGAVHAIAIPESSHVMTEKMGVYRLCADGGRALLGAGPAVDVRDPIPPLDAELTYIAVAYAADGAQAETRARVIVPSNGRVYMNWGERYERYAVCWRHAEIDDGTEKSVLAFEAIGRRSPLAFYGVQEAVKPQITAKVPIAHVGENDPHETTSAWKEAEKHIGTMCLRLPYSEGVRHYVTADVSVSVSNDAYRMADLKVSCIEVDHDGLA